MSAVLTVVIAASRVADWKYHEQSVLNLVLHGRWGELDESWNRQL